MGGDSQPQILTQLLSRVLRSGQSVTEAVAAPRWCLYSGPNGFGTWAGPYEFDLELERGAPDAWRRGLTDRGHRIADRNSGTFGHAHLIEIDPDGRAGGAADPRAETGTVAVA
ncbi:hypothetical protein GCM10029992_24100 [Glycomyces albus]